MNAEAQRNILSIVIKAIVSSFSSICNDVMAGTK